MPRNTQPLLEELSMVTVKHHEGSTVFSYEGESSRPWEQLESPIRTLIDQIQQEVERQEGIVGHIKAFVEDAGGSAGFSATGGEIHTRPGASRTSRIIFAAIVFVSDEGSIVDMMEQALSQL